ncbi:hypothetical protein BGAL_0080g00010 [Botrytis galanthina]|uniref:Major facilitator superfamily (MFS) profile domain-containing protein n=1 Tax=Botrytis galanthina TaxID=278940 RepID=A0A4S8R3L7_9HELO|nr:hypothetical protein BGAL_0080g00010 [Botrytis galanthina]
MQSRLLDIWSRIPAADTLQNWPIWLKWTVLIRVSFTAFLSPFNATVINPSLVLLSKAMGVGSKTATYSTTTCIIIRGLSHFICNPCINVYGRRPIALLATLTTVIGGIGSACSPNFATLVGTRAICGVGMGSMMSVGTAVANEMVFLHERGEKTSMYSIFVTNGGHIAALIGGYIGQAGGWQWNYWFGAVITGLALLFAIFCFLETLFYRDTVAIAMKRHERTYLEVLFNFKKNKSTTKALHMRNFSYAFGMLTWTFINVLPVVTVATIYTKFYHLKSGPIGVSLGISLTIESMIGGCCAGRASDDIMYHMEHRHNGERKLEYHLYLSSLAAIFMPAELLIFGGLLGKTGFVEPLVGFGIGYFIPQICSTTLYSYISDCYKSQPPETGILFNLSRGLSFVVGYFALPLAESIGYFWAWFVFASLLGLSYTAVGM